MCSADRRQVGRDLYLVGRVPKAMAADVALPPPLACDLFEDYLDALAWWFSGGGTNTGPHIDSEDNIICQHAGAKEFTMAPAAYFEAFPMDQQVTNSALDTDAVNMTKYEVLQHVPHFRVALRTGDCLFLPHFWTHAVRSFPDAATGRNLATNVFYRSIGDVDPDNPAHPDDPAENCSTAVLGAGAGAGDDDGGDGGGFASLPRFASLYHLLREAKEGDIGPVVGPAERAENAAGFAERHATTLAARRAGAAADLAVLEAARAGSAQL